MNSSRPDLSFVAVGTLALALLAGSAFGQAGTSSNTQGNANRAQGATQPGAVNPQTQAGRDFRASNVIGMNVRNPQNESLGEINDLIVDTTNGNVRYAVISFGGFLGMGDKLFAYPLNRFRIENRTNMLVLDVPREKLSNAPGFDRDRWPDWSSAEVRGEVDRFHGGGAASAANARYVRMSELLDADVQAMDGKDVGDIEDVVVDLPGGRVRYAVVEFDRAWTTNDRLVALPMRAFRPARDGDDLMLTVDQQRLQNAPAFDRNNWPDNDRGFRGTIDSWSTSLGFGPIYGAQPQQRDRAAQGNR